MEPDAPTNMSQSCSIDEESVPGSPTGSPRTYPLLMLLSCFSEHSHESYSGQNDNLLCNHFVTTFVLFKWFPSPVAMAMNLNLFCSPKWAFFNVLFLMLHCWTNHSQELCVGAFGYATVLLLLPCEQVFWGRASSVSFYFPKSLVPSKLQICKTFAQVCISVYVYIKYAHITRLWAMRCQLPRYFGEHL